jgi:hypothetical protein
MSVNGTVIDRTTHQANRRATRSAGRSVSAALACALLLASLLALHEVAQMRQDSSKAANSSRSIRTIRSFYAGLNDYLESGSPADVPQSVAPGVLAFLPETGAMGDNSQLLTWLLALRSTDPNLRFTVDHIEAGDDLAIATVRQSCPNCQTRTSQEFFRVRDGRIVQHWTTAPSSTLSHPLIQAPQQVTVTNAGHLAIAEVTFGPQEAEVHAIDGPALVLVQRGRLTLIGDGSSQILDIVTGEVSVPGPGERAHAEPGQAISITANQAGILNDSSEVAIARVATLAKDSRAELAGYPADRPLPPLAINDLSMMRSPATTAHGSATIRPLAFENRSIPPGTWQLETAWTLLGPGASLPESADGEWSLTHVMSGSPQHLTPSQGTISNTSAEPILALVLRLHASP